MNILKYNLKKSCFTYITHQRMKMMQEINELRLDCALKQKRGLHIILASIIIWLAIAIIQFYDNSNK